MSVETEGHDYTKSEVRERFERSGAAVSWKKRAEEGRRDDPGLAFYLRSSDPPEELG